MSDVATPFAIRTAVDLGIFPAIAAGNDQVSTLASAVGRDSDLLLRLLRFLSAVDFLEISADEDPRLTLTTRGTELADPESRTALALSGAAGDYATSVVNLAQALRTGGPVGKQYDLELVEATWAGLAPWTAPAVAVAEAFRDRDLLVAGPGAEIYVEEIQRRHPGTAVRVVDHKAPPPPDQKADAVIMLYPFDWRPRAELAGVQEFIAKLDVTEVHMVTNAVDTSGGDKEDYAQDLMRMCAVGTQIPTPADIGKLLAPAGFSIDAVRAVGWGTRVVVAR